MNFRFFKIVDQYRKKIICSFFLFFSILIFQNSFATDSLSYSGRLVKADGAPVAGPVDLTVDLAYTNAPGTILCSQNFNNVVLSNGVFHLKLDLVCPGPPVKTLTEILSAVPPTFAAALRVTDVNNSKVYAFQALHAMPFANLADTSKQLLQLGAANGQVLKWNDTTKKWEPGTPGGGGTVTNLTVTSPLAVVNGATTPALSITQATATVDGYLSAADWSSFNAKIGLAAGGTITQFYRGDKSWQTLNTDAVPDAGMTNLYFTNARALGVPLGATLDVVSLTGAITSADTILSAFGRTQNQINLINTNSSAYVTKMGTSTMVALGTIDAQAGFILVGAPGNINHATPRSYVNDQDALKVSKAGDSMSGVLTLDSDLKIKSGTTTNYVTIKGHATSDNYNLFLPSTDGNPGEVLKTDGTGNLSWINPSTVAAGSATVDSTAIVNGAIVDADIANATISYAKLNLSDGDIPLAKLSGASDATKYLRGDKSWSTFATDAIASALAGFTPFATKTDIAAGDSIFTAFQKTQKQLDDIDGDYVSKSGNNTVTGTFNISGITAFLNIPTPSGTTLSEATNVDYVKSYVGANGQWTKGTGGNAADIYFDTGKVGIGTTTPRGGMEIATGDSWSANNLGTNLIISGSKNNSIGFLDYLGANPYAIGSFQTVGFGIASMPALGTIATAPVYRFVINNSTGNVGIGTSAPASKLHISGGEVQLGSSGGACSVSNEGAQRYNSTTKRMDFCDGVGWQSLGTPAGEIAAYSQSTCPGGWLAANGSLVSRTTYAALFAAVSTSYGVGDGSTTFKLPDYRGYFLRGWSNGTGNDPNAATRTNRGDGTGGDVVGSIQTDDNKSHNHGVTDPGHFHPQATMDGIAGGNREVPQSSTYGIDYGDGAGAVPTGTVTTGVSIQANGGSESRPKNINVLYCIKY